MPMQDRVRFILWAVVVAALLAGEGYWVWSLRGVGILSTSRILVGGVVLLAGHGAIAALLATTHKGAIRLSMRGSVLIILGGAVLLQGAAVAWVVPVYGSDLARYRLDGGMWMSGLSPYRHTLNDGRRDFEHGGRFAPDKIDCDVAGADEVTRFWPTSEGTFVLARVCEQAFCPPLCVNLGHEAGEARGGSMCFNGCGWSGRRRFGFCLR